MQQKFQSSEGVDKLVTIPHTRDNDDNASPKPSLTSEANIWISGRDDVPSRNSASVMRMLYASCPLEQPGTQTRT